MSNTASLFSLIISILLALLVIPVGCRDAEVKYPQRKMPENFSSSPKHIDSGRVLFVSKCASCHGKTSEGRSDRAAFFNPPAPDFTDLHYKDVDPAYLYWRIETGKNVEPYFSQGSVMPAWGEHFSEEQIWQLVAYIRFRAH